MALIFSLLIILHYFSLSSQDLAVAESTLQNIENVLNNNNESQWMYSMPIVTNVYISFQNDTANFSVEHLELHVKECKKEEFFRCSERHVVCAVVNKGNISEVISCAPKEKHHHIINDLGYKEETAADLETTVRNVFEKSINNISKKSIVDIISVKTQETHDATEVYATVKVINADEGDALQFEVCEVEIIISQQSEAVARDSRCFPLSETQTQYSGSEDEMPKIAQEAVLHLNGLSQSKFAYNLHDIIRAEKMVTPGSQGSLINLQLKVAPSLCLKLLSFPLNKTCPENEDLTNMVCNLTHWNRPWKGDVIYSSPECRVDVEESAALQSFDVGSRSHDRKAIDDSEIEKYLESIIEVGVPEPEMSAGKISDSKPEEKIGATAALDIEDPVPAVEEPMIARKAFCLGCPVDLNVNNPDLSQFVDLALNSIDKSTTNAYKYGLVSVRKAQRQVVNGIMYMLLLDVGETECLKETNMDRNLCAINYKSDPNTCYIEIFEKPGLQKQREITFNNCTGIDDNYPSNDIVANPLSVSISKNEKVLTHYKDDDRPQFGSFDDLATVAADDTPYNYARGYSADYMEDIPFLGWDMGGYLSDSEEYYQTGQNARMKRRGVSGFIGGLKDIGPGEEQLVNDLAATAVETLDAIDEDNLKRVVVEVVDAKKQIMDGVMYHLKLVVGTSLCEENKAPNADCLKDLVMPLSLCTVHLHRSFVDNSLRVQVVRSECSPKEEGLSDDTFQPRTIDGHSTTTGASGVDVYNPQLNHVTEFALSEINKKLNVAHTLLNLINVHTEINDNINTYLTLKIAPCVDGNEAGVSCRPQITEAKICKSEVSEGIVQPSLELQNFSCSGLPDKQETRRLLGASSPVDVSDPYVQEVADSSLAELNRRSNNVYRRELIRVLSAEVQVVAGRLIHLRMEIGYSTCKKETEINSGDCSVRKDLGSQICDIKVWDRPWLKDRQIDKISCSPGSIQRRKRSEHSDTEPHRMLVGAPGNIDVDNSEVKSATAFAVSELDKESNSQFKRKPVKVLDAKAQVVAGILYHLTVETGETTCLKEADDNADECDLKEDSVNHICKVKVLVQAWANHRELTSSQCSPKPQARKKRATMQMAMPNPLIHGGSVKADVGDTVIKDVASFALKAIDRASNSAMKKKIVKILGAKSQVVEGKLYRLDLEIADTDCLKRDKHLDEECKLSENSETEVCHVEVWERMWLKNRKVTKLSCGSKHQEQLQTNGQYKLGNSGVLLGIFTDFMSKYNKTYNSDEEMQKRFHIFKANMMKIEHLQRTEQGTGKYGVTQFADLSENEFKQKYLGLNRALKRENEVPMANAKIPDVELPVEFDWRHYNVVTPVKNQGMCGSCWAFSVTGNVEGQWAINKGELLSLSEQELVDCDTLDNGCEGGLPDNAYRAIEKLGGLETEKDYPYEGEDEKCHFNRSEVLVTIQGAVNISTNETKMAQWLVKNGPISIGINANAMQFYLGGVSHPWKFLCDPDNLDHGVLIVGFGVHKYPLFKKTLPFWIIKNSWGDSWGEQGYYRVYRGDGTCGVNMMASSAIVA
ncbi:uncharacterized protein LOC124794718 isoform X1 [Schistocerca piceifrons]|uniref:uncharacterized protein LOC124794718 isoform X1 n=1 Tax=Schistocerca piceifrons TaxID=274613 RepID=UPI001F5FCA42|nr:uncharacterized protein LOC124794718 isoform X1 [Schistocerca piceifrons]